MSKDLPNNSMKNVNFNDDWTSHPIIEWLSTYKNILLGGFLVLFTLIILISRLIANRNLNAENDYFQAETAFSKLQKMNETSSLDASALSDLEQIENIMNRHPELKPKYQGALAQTLLIANQTPQAQAFAEDVFKRTSPDQLNLYQNYSENSLLISKGLYKEALEKSLQLRTFLDQSSEPSLSLLYVFNLIRLANLYQQTAQAQQELDTWKQFQNQPQRSEAVLLANQVFNLGQSSLSQYIEERKKALSSLN